MLDNLGQVLPTGAQTYGDKTALIFKGRAFSYRELNALSARLAGGLRTLGVQQDDRVTLYTQNCWEYVVSYFAIARLGAVINPLNVMLTPDEVRFVVSDCGAKVVLASQAKGAGLRDALANTPVRELILFGDEAVAGTCSFNALIEASAPLAEDVVIRPDSLSTIGYTSGTTGHPKGAMQSQRAVLLNAAMTATMHVRTAADTVVSALPLPHVYGNVVMNGALLYGGTIVVLERFSEQETCESIQRYGATILDGVPTMYMYLLNYPELERYDLSSLTRCAVGGQTMPVSKMQEVEQRFGVPLLELWGMTELAGLGTTHPFFGINRLGSIGVPLPYTEARIADLADAAKTLGPDEPGELMIRGPLVMMGYYGNDEATRQTIEPDGWLHTGDVARMDQDGYLYIVDRKKDMINTAGFNVYPAEIERVVAAHPAVAMVAVGSVPDELKGELARAYVVLKGGAQATEDEILAFCKEQLAAYKVPRSVAFVPDLPKTSTGKIMRRELKKLDL
jgi:long-chain acyl-CoA synthetase